MRTRGSAITSLRHVLHGFAASGSICPSMPSQPQGRSRSRRRRAAVHAHAILAISTVEPKPRSSWGGRRGGQSPICSDGKGIDPSHCYPRLLRYLVPCQNISCSAPEGRNTDRRARCRLICLPAVSFASSRETSSLLSQSSLISLTAVRTIKI